MQQDEEIDLSARKFTSRLVIERALVRGWHVTGFETNTAVHLLKVPGKDMPIKIFGSSPPQMSFPAVLIANDKYISSAILGQAGIPVPEDKLLSISKPFDQQGVDEFLQKHSTVIVKPLDSAHGQGITIDIKTKDRLMEACEEAKKYTKKDKVLLQQQVEGGDVRIICIGYEYAAAITRIPANVKADGVHNISELIDIENAKDYRGINYKARLNCIDKDAATRYLGSVKMNQVPSEGQNVRVIGVANIGMGGERKIITKNIPDFLIDMAIKAAKILELPVCAVDFITAVEPQVNQIPEELNPYLIEPNSCPQLLISDDPHSEEQTAIIDKYLDLIAK